MTNTCLADILIELTEFVAESGWHGVTYGNVEMSGDEVTVPSIDGTWRLYVKDVGHDFMVVLDRDDAHIQVSHEPGVRGVVERASRLLRERQPVDATPAEYAKLLGLAA